MGGGSVGRRRSACARRDGPGAAFDGDAGGRKEVEVTGLGIADGEEEIAMDEGVAVVAESDEIGRFVAATLGSMADVVNLDGVGGVAATAAVFVSLEDGGAGFGGDLFGVALCGGA